MKRSLRSPTILSLALAVLFAAGCGDEGTTGPSNPANTSGGASGGLATGGGGSGGGPQAAAGGAGQISVGGMLNAGGMQGSAGGALNSAGGMQIASGGMGGMNGMGGSTPSDGGALNPDPDGGPPVGNTGTLPPVTDLGQPGPFTPMLATGPGGFVVYQPTELGQDGVKHPIVAWGPGAVENAGSFTTLLRHLASHGFAVISYDATPSGPELVQAIDWMIAENARQGSPFHEKLDSTKIAAGGHSAGSLATFRIGADQRLTTTLHISGGTFSPHTDINNLHAPTLFICGESGGDGLIVGDVARANCDIDFDNATVPVVYGVTKGASHMTPTEIGDVALRRHQLAAMAGWLRFQLAADESLRDMFVGGACTLCTDPNWTIQQKGWN